MRCHGGWYVRGLTKWCQLQGASPTELPAPALALCGGAEEVPPLKLLDVPRDDHADEVAGVVDALDDAQPKLGELCGGYPPPCEPASGHCEIRRPRTWRTTIRLLRRNISSAPRRDGPCPDRAVANSRSRLVWCIGNRENEGRIESTTDPPWCGGSA